MNIFIECDLCGWMSDCNNKKCTVCRYDKDFDCTYIKALRQYQIKKLSMDSYRLGKEVILTEDNMFDMRLSLREAGILNISHDGALYNYLFLWNVRKTCYWKFIKIRKKHKYHICYLLRNTKIYCEDILRNIVQLVGPIYNAIQSESSFTDGLKKKILFKE